VGDKKNIISHAHNAGIIEHYA